MSLQSLLSAVRRWWSTLLVATVVAGATGLLLASTIPAAYESRASLLVGPVSGDVDTIRAAGLLVQTFAELSTSDQVLSAAATETGARDDLTALRTRVRTTGDNVTRVLTVRVEMEDPELAARLATSIAGQLAALSSTDTSRPEGQVQVIHAAVPDPVPVAPRPLLIMGLAALAGLLGSATLVVLLERLSGYVRSREELADLAGVPPLAELPSSPRGQATMLVAEADPASRAAAAHRLLASRLGIDRVPAVASRLHVAGVGSDTSAALVAANLAAIASAQGIPVAVIDADPDGVASVILTSSTHDSGMPSPVRLLSPGLDGVAPMEHRAAAAAGIEEAGASGGLVIVIGGSIGRDQLDLVWAGATGRTLLVVERERTQRHEVQAALERLQNGGAEVVTVLAVPPRARDLRELLGGTDEGPGRRLAAIRLTGARRADGDEAGGIRLDPSRPRAVPPTRSDAAPGKGTGS